MPDTDRYAAQRLPAVRVHRSGGHRETDQTGARRKLDWNAEADGVVIEATRMDIFDLFFFSGYFFMIISGVGILLDIAIRWRSFYRLKSRWFILSAFAIGTVLIFSGI